MVVVQVNPNFHIIGGKGVFRSRDPRFLEYRRKWDEWPRSFYVGDFPLHLDIEASGKCDLRCPFCAVICGSVGEGGFMSLDLFKKIIDEGAEHGLCAIKLNSGERGEPLLNKFVDKMVAYAKDKGIMDVYLNTNATLLTRDMSEKLIEAGLDRISISFEGTDAETYERYRVGASYSKVLANMKELVRLREEMGVEKPLVRMQMVALPELQPKLDEYKEFWEPIADEVAFIDFKDYSHEQLGLTHDWACPYLWQRMMVRWDGAISICGFDYSENLGLGKVGENTIRSAWKGEVMEKIRELHKSGKSQEVEVCNGCCFRTTEILKLKEMEDKR